MLPGTPGYDTARQIWNGMVDRRPAAVIRCADTADVSAAIRATRDLALPLSVRGGGHQVAGAAVVEGGVVVDLGGMRSADIDVVGSTVTVGGGALLGDLDRQCARYAVAVPAGVVSHTGVGGLTLGGGIGWLCRSRGLTCDVLTSAVVVNGGGNVIHASASEHPDLFWALRGGGGNFGAVTQFVFRTAPIDDVLYGLSVVPLEHAAGALAHIALIEDDLPCELQIMLKLQRFTGHDAEPDPYSQPVLTVESGSGPVRWNTLRPSNGCWPLKLVPPGRGAASSPPSSPSRITAIRTDITITSSPATSITSTQRQSRMVEAIRLAPPGDHQIEIMRLGGAIADVAEHDTAFPRRDACLSVNVSSAWSGDDVGGAEWVRHTHDSVVRARSAYVNFVGAGGPSLDDVYGAGKGARLREIKHRYDPDGVFTGQVPVLPATPKSALEPTPK
jgi:FAD/FMN-containing dehydrogenase